MEEWLKRYLPGWVHNGDSLTVEKVCAVILAKHEELLREQKHGASSMCCDLREQAVAELDYERQRSKRLPEALAFISQSLLHEQAKSMAKIALAEYEKGGKEPKEASKK